MSENSLTLSCPNCGEPILLEISKVLKQPASIQDIKGVLDRWIEDVDVTEENDSIVVIPKGFLGKELWYQINNALKPFDADYVSAGKESRWVIRKSQGEE
jgi:hypothetical protein